MKTVGGNSPDKCCNFPFLYKGTERISCVKAVKGDRMWCGVTYNYDKEKKWGWCPSGTRIFMQFGRDSVSKVNEYLLAEQEFVSKVNSIV